MFYLYWKWNDGRLEDAKGQTGWRRARYNTLEEAKAQAVSDIEVYGLKGNKQAPIRIEDAEGEVVWNAE